MKLFQKIGLSIFLAALVLFIAILFMTRFEVNTSNLYYAKKGLQKIVRSLNKSLRFSGNKQTEVEVRMHFCACMREMNINLHHHTTIHNLYYREIGRIEKAMKGLHEDLQADYELELDQYR